MIDEGLLSTHRDSEDVDLRDDARVGANDRHATSFRGVAQPTDNVTRETYYRRAKPPARLRQLLVAGSPFGRHGAFSRKGAGLPMPLMVLFDDANISDLGKLRGLPPAKIRLPARLPAALLPYQTRPPGRRPRAPSAIQNEIWAMRPAPTRTTDVESAGLPPMPASAVQS